MVIHVQNTACLKHLNIDSLKLPVIFVFAVLSTLTTDNHADNRQQEFLRMDVKNAKRNIKKSISLAHCSSKIHKAI